MNIHNFKVSFDRKKYDRNAKEILKINPKYYSPKISDFPEYIATPYIKCFNYLKQNLKKDDLILEIGSGSGFFTRYLLLTEANVIATDVSSNSLKLINLQHSGNQKLNTMIADMESLPFKANKFEFIVSIGTLSYGDHIKVSKEIYRCLKKGGKFIFIDSLSHNPFYVVNRFLQFVFGKRSFSTILNMPTEKTICSFKNLFREANVSYYGMILFLVPILKLFFTPNKIRKISEYFDGRSFFNKYAFKVFMICEK